MKRENLNTFLLLVCVALLSLCVYKLYQKPTSPTLEQIDERIQFWGQHFGATFSQ